MSWVKWFIPAVVLVCLGWFGGADFAADIKADPGTEKEPPLPPGARARLGTARLVHSTQVYMMAFSPDGKLLASNGQDGYVRFWDTSTGKETGRINTTEGNNPIAFNPYGTVIGFAPDGKTSIVGITGKPLQVHDTATGKLLRTFGEANNQGTGVAFSFTPDGKTLATSTRNFNDKTIRIWEVESGKELQKLDGHDNLVSALAFSTDGKTLVSGSEDQTVRIWDAANGKQRKLLEGHRSGVNAVVFSRDGKLFATNSTDQSVRIWDAESGNEVQRINNARLYVSGYGVSVPMRFSEDGKNIIGLGSYGIFEWEVGTGKNIRKPEGQQPATANYVMSADGKMTARTFAGRIILQNTEGKDLFPGETSTPIASLAVSPSGKHFAAGGTDKIIRVYSLNDCKEVKRLEGHVGSIGFLQFLADGKTLISASRDYNDRTISFWDIETGKERGLRSGGTYIYAVSASANGKVLGYLVQDPQGLTLKLHDLVENKEIRQTRTNYYSYTLALAPQGDMLISQIQDGSFALTDVARGEQTRSLIRNQSATPLFSPDGKSVAVRSSDGLIYLWDVASGREVRQLGEKNPNDPRISGQFNPLNTAAVAFSSDGRLLASSGKDGTIRVWELAGGKERRVFQGHQSMINGLAFTPDCATLISASQDSTVLLWDLVNLTTEEAKLTSVPSGSGDNTHVQKLWEDLLSDDAAKAYRAIRALRSAPAFSLPFLKGRMQPIAGVDSKVLDKMIVDLDSGEFEVRDKASQDLEKLGPLAEPALRRMLATKPSLEVTKRIEALLTKLEVRILAGESLRTNRALEALEHMAGDDARVLIETLARGAEGAELTTASKAALSRMDKRRK